MYMYTLYEPHPKKMISSGFKTRSDTRRAIQPQKLAASQVEAWRSDITPLISHLHDKRIKPLFIRIVRFI